jgi:hypothetical protein
MLYELTPGQYRAGVHNLADLGLGGVNQFFSDLAQDQYGAWRVAPQPGGMFVNLDEVSSVFTAYRGDLFDPRVGKSQAFRTAFDRILTNPASLFSGEAPSGFDQRLAPLNAYPSAYSPSPSATAPGVSMLPVLVVVAGGALAWWLL